MVHRLKMLGRRDEGAVALLTVILVSAVFIGLAALVVDLGLGRDTRRQAQNAADSAALAAGNALYPSGAPTADVTGATNAAMSYAAANYGVTPAEWLACTDSSMLGYRPDSSKPCISFDNATSPRTVRVAIPTRDVETPFAQIWGVNRVPVSASAKVQLALAWDRCGLCVIGTGTHDIQNGDILVSGASVAFNGILDARNGGSIRVTGGGSLNISLENNVPNNGTFLPAPLEDQAPVPDPLANLVLPNYGYLKPQNPLKTHSCADGPGIYASLEACPTGMTAGLYVITGQSHLSGQASIVANGATLFFTCGTPALPRPCNVGESGGDLIFTGQGTLAFAAPSSGPLTGLAIVADRNNTATFDFRGNGAQDNGGTIYAPSGTLKYRGNGGGYALKSLVVVGDMAFDGNPSAFESASAPQLNVLVSSDLHLSE